MFKTELGMIEISFSIPQWFPPDRLDYTKTHYYDQHHAYAGSYDHSTFHNSAEDNLFNRFKELNEICNYYWVKFEYEGNPEQLPEWIELKKKQLNKFFNRYKEAKE